MQASVDTSGTTRRQSDRPGGLMDSDRWFVAGSSLLSGERCSGVIAVMSVSFLSNRSVRKPAHDVVDFRPRAFDGETCEGIDTEVSRVRRELQNFIEQA